MEERSFKCKVYTVRVVTVSARYDEDGGEGAPRPQQNGNAKPF